MPLPENRKRSETIAGGTAVSHESHTSLWIGIGALVLVGAGVAYAAMGDDSTKTATPTTQPAEDEAIDEAALPQDAPVGDTGDVGISLDEAPTSASEERRQAVASLEQGLSEQRLWSTVSVQGSTLSLVSGACSDEGMRPAISKFTSALASVGFTTIRCLEKHGEQVFEQGL